MDLSPFAIALVVVSLPIVGFVAVAAWLAERRIGRVRLVDRTGKTVAEVVLGHPDERG
ncbi:MAG: hypothetical protein KJ007_15630 [Burkholderiales bacterium]|nr:hypothetical protein [Burkholderiales bacterium]MCL4689993.1 hypothetical protein [Burkholderiales bacterium]